MAYNDPPTRPDGWPDPTADRDVRRGRHRARHADAAPDAYNEDTAPGAYPEESYGYAYGDGVSADPMYGRDPAPPGRHSPEGPSRDVHRDPRRSDLPQAGRPATGPTRPAPVDPSWRPGPVGTSEGRSPDVAGPYGGAVRGGSVPNGVTAIPDGRDVPPTRRQRATDLPGRSVDPRLPARNRLSSAEGNQAIEGVTRPMPQVGVPSPGGFADETSLNLGLSQGPSRDSGAWRQAETSSADPPQSTEHREEAGDPARSGRAGRDLPKAIGVGVLLVGVVLGSLFLWRPAFVAVLAAAACVGIWEMVTAFSTPRVAASAGSTTAVTEAAAASNATEAGAAQRPRARPPLVPLVGGCLVMAPLAYYGGVESLTLGLLVTILAVIVWRLSSGPAGFARDVSAATLIAAYVPFLLFFGVLLAVPHDGDLRVLCILAMVVLSDTGGYAAGVFFGRHTIAPSISPKKSWEGLAGSLVATGVGAAFLVHYLLHQPYWQGAIIGVAVSAAAVLGDLAESLLKRDLGIKDMSNLLPGHGGVMDRLDSVVFAAPTAFMLLALLAPVAR